MLWLTRRLSPIGVQRTVDGQTTGPLTSKNSVPDRLREATSCRGIRGAVGV